MSAGEWTHSWNEGAHMIRIWWVGCISYWDRMMGGAVGRPCICLLLLLLLLLSPDGGKIRGKSTEGGKRWLLGGGGAGGGGGGGIDNCC